MNTKTVFDRLQSIDDEVQKLHNTIFALKTTDIQAYADKYEELSISAALRSERLPASSEIWYIPQLTLEKKTI